MTEVVQEINKLAASIREVVKGKFYEEAWLSKCKITPTIEFALHDDDDIWYEIKDVAGIDYTKVLERNKEVYTRLTRPIFDILVTKQSGSGRTFFTIDDKLNGEKYTSDIYIREGLLHWKDNKIKMLRSLTYADVDLYTFNSIFNRSNISELTEEYMNFNYFYRANFDIDVSDNVYSLLIYNEPINFMYGDELRTMSGRDVFMATLLQILTYPDMVDEKKTIVNNIKFGM